MNTIAPTLVLLTFLLPIAFFSIYGFWRSTDESEGSSLDDRFLHASQKAKKGDISGSTVSYMLQISTTFYFIYWGYNYGTSNILYLVSWGVGMWLFSLYAPRLLAVRSSYVTLAGFLSVCCTMSTACRRPDRVFLSRPILRRDLIRVRLPLEVICAIQDIPRDHRLVGVLLRARDFGILLLHLRGYEKGSRNRQSSAVHGVCGVRNSILPTASKRGDAEWTVRRCALGYFYRPIRRPVLLQPRRPIDAVGQTLPRDFAIHNRGRRPFL